MRLCTLFILTLSILQAQQVKLISEVAVRPGTNQATMFIRAVSKNDTSYTMDSMRLSLVTRDVCHTFSFISRGAVLNSWGFTNMQYLDSTFNVSYLGNSYDRRYYFNHQNHPAADSSLIIPDSSQSPITLLEIIFTGTCPREVYLESDIDNTRNALVDTTGRTLTFCVEDRGFFNPDCDVNFLFAEDDPGQTLKYNFSAFGGVSPDSILWDFGDGATNTISIRPSHTYASPGIYQVCLTMSDTLGCKASHCKTISVAQDSPVCLIDSADLRVVQQRNRGSRAFTISGTVLADSVRYDMGDGSEPYKGIWSSSAFGHQYPAVDTYRVRAIGYANRYGGILQCADTTYTTIVVPEPEVRICAQLGPGSSEDTLFFSISNLTDDTIAIRSIGCTAFLDKSCLNVTGASEPLLDTYGDFRPINPRFNISDSVSFTAPDGTRYERLVGFGHSRNQLDSSRTDLLLEPKADTYTPVTAFGLSGTCRNNFYVAYLGETLNGSGAEIGFSDGNGNPRGTIVALTEIGCSNSLNILPSKDNAPALTIWPNPTDDLVLIQLNEIRFHQYHIKVCDQLGKEVQSWTRPMQEGMAIRLRLGHLPAGMYYVEVQDEAQILPVMSKPVMLRK